MPTDEPRDVLAAGVVAFRPGRRVLLVHRPKYDDWSFPKGKLDPGEHPTAAAVREVAEETGIHVRLAAPLANQRYSLGPRMKTVHYWTGRPVGEDDVSGYRANEEIDGVEWVRLDEAPKRLTYDIDRQTLAEARQARRASHAVVVLRHGDARSRRAWRGDDRLRPLLVKGRAQAERLVPLLAAYDVTRVVSSSSTRCVETLTPYLHTTGWEVDSQRRLSEEDATATAVAEVVDELVDRDQGAVICTHRPVLPLVFDALGLEEVELEPGEMFVTHLRKGRVTSTERHHVT